MENWNTLDLSQKADLLKIYVANGYTSLDNIKNHYNSFADGGSIYIKPSHRGRLTELKERTGKSEAELYNDGNPAHKKMVVFARNARKWKHDDGGYLDNLTIKPFSYSPIPVVRYANGGPRQSFRRWSKAISDYKGIDIRHDDTYDYRGFYNDNPDYAYSMLGEDPEAHFPDTWKTPKHPTFSDESIYSTDKKKGGHWVELPNGGWEFQHSDYTFDHSDETNQYLRENDPTSYATYRGGIVLDGEPHGLSETRAKVFAPFYRGTFSEAFAKARSKDKDYFRWKGNLYNTRLAPDQTTEIKGSSNERMKNPYNIFLDENSFGARDTHRKSLEAWVAKNPRVGNLETKDFIGFFSQLAGLEGSYNAKAGEGMKYSGYYGLEGGRNLTSDEQHRKAFEHLKSIFDNNMVKEDIQKGMEAGYTPAQILTKYWNQGNRVTNFLYNGIDSTDGVGTKISDYGWNVTADVDYDKYLMPAITQDYIEITDTTSLADMIKRARVEGVDYSDRENYFLNLNGTAKGDTIVPLDATKLQKGQKVYTRK